MQSPQRPVHASGWFSYQQKQGAHRYKHCILLKDLVFVEDCARDMTVTFHQDARCIKGAVIDVIEESAHDRQLMGWQGDEEVLDLFY